MHLTRGRACSSGTSMRHVMHHMGSLSQFFWCRFFVTVRSAGRHDIAQTHAWDDGARTRDLMRDRHVRHIAGVDSTGPWLAADGPFYPVVVQVCGPDVAQARAKECTPHSDQSVQFADQDTRRCARLSRNSARGSTPTPSTAASIHALRTGYGQLESHRACSRGIARIKGRRSPSGTALPGTNAEPESPDAFLLAG